MAQNIVLVGFPGAGKSTIGKNLAPLLGLRFVDLDKYVEQRFQYSVPQLFAQFGELVFRKCEFEALSEILQDNHQLIATGGGTPCYEQAMQLIKKKNFSIYIKMSEEAIVQRLSKSKKPRPLTSHLSLEELQAYVHQTLQKRAHYYEQAHLIVDGENLDIPRLAEEIHKMAI